MNILVALFGAFMAVMTAWGAVRPKQILAILAGLPAQQRFRLAVGVRILMGVVFLLGAPRCRYPLVIFALGVLAIVAAIVLVPIGPKRLERIIQRMSQLPAWLIRLLCLVGVAFGAFVIYCGLPD